MQIFSELSFRFRCAIEWNILLVVVFRILFNKIPQKMLSFCSSPVFLYGEYLRAPLWIVRVLNACSQDIYEEREKKTQHVMLFMLFGFFLFIIKKNKPKQRITLYYIKSMKKKLNFELWNTNSVMYKIMNKVEFISKLFLYFR